VILDGSNGKGVIRKIIKIECVSNGITPAEKSSTPALFIKVRMCLFDRSGRTPEFSLVVQTNANEQSLERDIHVKVSQDNSLISSKFVSFRQVRNARRQSRVSQARCEFKTARFLAKRSSCLARSHAAHHSPKPELDPALPEPRIRNIQHIFSFIRHLFTF